MESNHFYVIDTGHGGIDPETGQYTTSPELWKRAYFDDSDNLLPASRGIAWLEANCSWKIYEGVINRVIGGKLSKMMYAAGIDHVVIPGDHKDWPLHQRTSYSNLERREQSREVVQFSIHCNAFNGSAQGSEVYTSKGQTFSDVIAQELCLALKSEFPDRQFRADTTDGDLDREENFWMLLKYSGPSVLGETFFFDNPSDAKLLLSEKGTDKIAKAYFTAVMKTEKMSL